MGRRRRSGERDGKLRGLLRDICEFNALMRYTARGAAERVARWPDGRARLWADGATMVADLLGLQELTAELEAKAQEIISDD